MKLPLYKTVFAWPEVVLLAEVYCMKESIEALNCHPVYDVENAMKVIPKLATTEKNKMSFQFQSMG